MGEVRYGLEALIIWQILSHVVIYQRLENEQIVQVASIKPN